MSRGGVEAVGTSMRRGIGYATDPSAYDEEQPVLLGGLEQLSLLAVARLGPRSYGVFLCHEIRKRTGRELLYASVYKALKRLELRGYVVGSVLAGAGSTGPHPRRFFELTGVGHRALRISLSAADAMRAGLNGLDHPAAARDRLQ